MDFGHGKMRLKVEGDRLSSLPDELIHKILFFTSMRDAIGTSVLSHRWWFLWTSMSHLNFSSEGFSTLPNFSKFIRHVMSRLKARNNLTNVHSVKISFRGKAKHSFVQRILKYVLSHNIQHLDVECLLKNSIEFPTLFSSQALKHLNLTMRTGNSCHPANGNGYLTSTLELPTLSTLDLHYVTLYDDNNHKCIVAFSKCPNLKNLTLKHFKTKGSNSFTISHPQLSNLTLENSCSSVKVVNVAAPQLKNLTIRHCDVELVVSTPNLTSLFYKGFYNIHLSTEAFRSLEKAHISVSHQTDAHQIVKLLQQLHCVKFLALNLEIVELLSSSVGLLLPQPSTFVNLKSLNIYPETEYYVGMPHKKVAMSTELKRYLVDSSPGCTFTMVLREEIVAQKHMTELEALLEKEKDNTKMNRAHQGKSIDQSKSKTKVVKIKSYWEKFGEQMEKVCLIISKLQLIEELLLELPPASDNRAKIQSHYSSLCAEAHITITKIMDYMKTQRDENQSLPDLS